MHRIKQKAVDALQAVRHFGAKRWVALLLCQDLPR